MAHTLKLAVAASMMLASAALAQDAKPEVKPQDQPAKTLTIGDAAPALDISNWIKGDKVTKFENGKIYVVEFWATWCGPCRVSMPHLSEAQKQYKDYGVTFIGISDEPLDTVTKFLDSTDKGKDKKWSEIIGYTLTTDPDKSVYNDYFKAAGQRGIPCAFIVGRDQHIEWIGNPHPQSEDGFDKALESVVKDTWDRKTFKADWEKSQAKEREQAAAQEARMKEQAPLMKAMQTKDWPKVLEITDGMLAKDPKDLAAGTIKFRTLAISMNKPEEGYEFLKKFIEPYWDDAEVLNQFSWTIVDEKELKSRNIDLALGYAMRANKLSGGNNPAILDTFARCWYEKGNLAEAVKYEGQAAAVAGDDQMGQDIKATLKKYQDEAAKKGG